MSKKQKFVLVVAMAIFVFGLVSLLRWGNLGEGILGQITVGEGALLPIVVIAALIDSINPCAFSILLLTIAFLVSMGKLRAGILKIGGAYIFGIFAAYFLIGLGILRAFEVFNIPGFMGKAGAVLLVIVGVVVLLGVLFPAFPVKFKIPTIAHRRIALLMEKGSMPSALLLGGLVGMVEFPCTGAAYLMILGLLHDHRTYVEGLAYLLLYNAIFVLPLVAVLFLAGNEVVLSKIDMWRKEKTEEWKTYSAIAMITLGIIIFFL